MESAPPSVLAWVNILRELMTLAELRLLRSSIAPRTVIAQEGVIVETLVYLPCLREFHVHQ